MVMDLVADPCFLLPFPQSGPEAIAVADVLSESRVVHGTSTPQREMPTTLTTSANSLAKDESASQKTHIPRLFS
jgi:hypothetical protein